jgi:hypothetical protein
VSGFIRNIMETLGPERSIRVRKEDDVFNVKVEARKKRRDKLLKQYQKILVENHWRNCPDSNQSGTPKRTEDFSQKLRFQTLLEGSQRGGE